MIDQIIKANTSVLLVEQDEGLKQLLVHLLQENYQVMVVKNVIEAWRYLFSGESLPNLLIIDLDVNPQKSAELVKQIKANGILRGIPVIMLCTEQSSPIPIFQEIGEIFFKPFNPDDLKETILKLVDP